MRERERERERESERVCRVEAILKGLLGSLYNEKIRLQKIARKKISLASSGDAGLFVGPLDG